MHAPGIWGIIVVAIVVILLFVRGKVKSLGAECIKKEMRTAHIAKLRDLLGRAGVKDVKPEEFTRYGSARTLYNFNIDNADAY